MDRTQIHGDRNAAVPAARVRWGGRRWRAVASYLWVLPALALYGLFTIVPLISGIWLALLRWDGIEDAEFIGLDNFERMLRG